MKVLVATEKPFAAAAVEGIKKEIESAGNELVLLEKYTEKAQLLEAVADVDHMIIRSDKVHAEVLPRVEYTLTELGYSLKPVLDSLWNWGEEYKTRH